MKNIINNGHRARLRKRFITSELNSFSEHEKLEFLLTFIIQRKDCKPIAKNLLKKFKTFSGVLDAETGELITIKGIGETSAILLKSIKAFAQEYLKSNIENKKKINSIKDVLDYLKLKFSGAQDENVCVMLLDTKNNFLSFNKISSGTIDESPVYIRKIIDLALKKNAKSIILVHNHPSGEVQPSSADKRITKKIKQALEIVELNFYDHIIVGYKNYFSFVENKEL
jgi:DNA repair protein RadC